MPDNFDALVSRLLERRPDDNRPDEVKNKNCLLPAGCIVAESSTAVSL
jgi:hypothetical protein